MSTPSPNGRQAPPPTPEQQLEAFVYANYAQIAAQLGAINTLLGPMPLAALLAANKRMQTVSVLTLPANIPAEQAQATAAAMRGDQRVIEAALNLQRVAQAVVSGG